MATEDAVLETPVVVDRGDTLTPVVPAAVVDDKAAKADVDAELAALGKADEKADDKGDDKADDDKSDDDKADDDKTEQARGKDGKFKPNDNLIPKDRFNEAVGKERTAREAAEARAELLEKQLREREASVAKTTTAAELETKVTELEGKYTKLLLDGNEKEAADVMREIRMTEREIVRAELSTGATTQVQMALEGERLTVAIATLEAAYPELNEKSETYDSDLTDLVLSKQSTLIKNEGLTPSAALTRAAKEVMTRFAKKDEPAAEKVEKKGLSAAEQIAEDRRAAQVAKNVDAAARQPASAKDVGLDSNKLGQQAALPEADKMTKEEFDALPAAVKARMRGDTI